MNELGLHVYLIIVVSRPIVHRQIETAIDNSTSVLKIPLLVKLSFGYCTEVLFTGVKYEGVRVEISYWNVLISLLAPSHWWFSYMPLRP